jgi:hypothetical protein
MAPARMTIFEEAAFLNSSTASKYCALGSRTKNTGFGDLAMAKCVLRVLLLNAILCTRFNVTN